MILRLIRLRDRIAFAACSMFFLKVPASYAQSLIPEDGAIPGGDCNLITGDLHATCIPDYLQYLIGVFFTFIGVFFFIMIVFAGYQIALGSAFGDKEAGKNKLKNAIFGFIISALSFFIIKFVLSTIAST